MMYMTLSMSSRRDLLFPRHEFSEANRKLPENFRTYCFSKCRPSSSR
jgi:hypothetical protein